MHVQDGPQLDLPAQVAKVKQKARPWKAIIALILAIAAAVVSSWAHRYFHDYFQSSNIQYQVIAAGCAGVAVMGGVMRAADPGLEVGTLVATLQGVYPRAR